MSVLKIVFLCGGNGSHVTGPYGGLFDVTIICPTADSGGSSGELVREYNTIPVGDMRRAFLNGIPASRRCSIAGLFERRFKNGCLQDHAVGNIIITGVLEAFPDPNNAMDELGRIFGIHHNWHVYPATLTPIQLVTTSSDGTHAKSEGELNQRTSCHAHVTHAEIVPGNAPGNPVALDAIRNADLVIMGPTDHVTSLLSILLVKDIAEALRETKAKCIYVANLMTKPNETFGYGLTDYVSDIHRYAGAIIDHVVVNTGTVPAYLRKKYLKKGQDLVHADSVTKKFKSIKVTRADLLMQIGEGEETKFIRHDPFKLVGTIGDIFPEMKRHLYGYVFK